MNSKTIDAPARAEKDTVSYTAVKANKPGAL
jgi:hypothetical protein